MPLRHALALTTALAWAMLSNPTAAQAPRRDGTWAVTVTVDVEGATSPLLPRTITQCVTPEQAASGKDALHLDDRSALGDCAASDHKVEGKRVTWTFTCQHPKPVSGTGEIVYESDSAYAGAIALASDGQRMTIKYSGKRTGDCQK